MGSFCFRTIKFGSANQDPPMNLKKITVVGSWNTDILDKMQVAAKPEGKTVQEATEFTRQSAFCSLTGFSVLTSISILKELSN